MTVLAPQICSGNSKNGAEFRADFDAIDQKLGIRVMKSLGDLGDPRDGRHL